jgi:methylmalonyl-CoA/ethylmalonyl-CoA epimerase
VSSNWWTFFSKGASLMGDGRYIKHMAFAVKDAHQALTQYQEFLGVGLNAEIHDYPKSRNRVAIFNVGEVEYQLCQSLDAGGRFDAWITQRGYEGLHHICYAVPNIDQSLADAQAKGATLKECSACKVKGSHPHPEGWVAFLEQEAGGIELELMQVYTPEQLEEYKAVKGI